MLEKYISKVQYVGIFQKLSLNNSSDVVTSVYCAGEICAEASMLTSLPVPLKSSSARGVNIYTSQCSEPLDKTATCAAN